MKVRATPIVKVGVWCPDALEHLNVHRHLLDGTMKLQPLVTPRLSEVGIHGVGLEGGYKKRKKPMVIGRKLINGTSNDITALYCGRICILKKKRWTWVSRLEDLS